MRVVVKLSSLKLREGRESVISHLVNNDKPIFFIVPANKNVWHVLLNYQDIFNYIPKRIKQNNFFYKKVNDKNEISTLKLVKGVCYGFLKRSQIITLVNSKTIPINEVNVVMAYDENGEFNFATEMVLTSEVNNFKEFSLPYIESVEHGKMLFTDKSVNSYNKYSDIENNSVHIDVDFDSLYVFESDIESYIVNDLNAIPDDSPYFIPIELRQLTELDQLAVLGYQLFANNCKSTMKSKDLAAKIERTLGYSGKKADVAAYFLSPSPKGKRITAEPLNNINPNCKFPFLVKALNTYGVNSATGAIAKVNQSIQAFFSDLGFSEDNVKYAEIMIRIKKQGD
ncbi:hypothetical protein K5M76_09695 [Shewanella xiamenensis]|uniref:hypothetical protein n=1 Tax=Shewanella TaxID=22 RepID=UPI00002FE2BF|nr:MULTISPECIES: hypothetical protein [Shewanella]MCT8857521.1 hypothetical protein [Shewanella xiamenensis]MDH1627362.1 hypothetical protein [Shewanella xiamenensis]MDV5248862.1 hypothetical protein [Shewanella xiamenensis]PWH02691.1 hypothetical protein DIY08_11850 [Shewanella xiamenensis]UWG66462.1 hypothetical protein K5M76_09695 [Shewanella xiamenensis]